MRAVQEQLDAIVPGLLAEHGVPGIAIGIRAGGERLELGYGVTSIENPLPVDGRTLFQVGSVSKTLTGLLVQRLVELGVVELDAPIAPILAGLATVDPRITMRHLLTHMSGIDGQNMIAEAPRLLANGADDSLATAIGHFIRQPLRSTPGEVFSYSGPGYQVAGNVLERLTGRRFRDLLTEFVLRPAGMDRTFSTADEAITYRVAAPHGVDDGEAIVLHDRGWQRHWQLPAWDLPGGGVVSSAHDLVSFLDHLLGPEGAPAVFEPHANYGIPGADAGLPWRLSPIGYHRSARHAGLTIGYASQIMALPDDGMGFVVLTNSVVGVPLVYAVSRAIERALLGVDDLPDLAQRHPADLADFEGEYEFGSWGTSRLEISGPDSLRLVALPAREEPGTFQLAPPSAEKLVVHSSHHLLILEPERQRGELLRYITDASGHVVALHNSRTAYRVGP